MRRPVILAAMLTAAAALVVQAVPAAAGCCGHHHHGCAGCACAGQGPAAGAGNGSGPALGRIYDPASVTTLSGTVADVSVAPGRRGSRAGTHIRLESEGKATEVHLGPSWFLEREKLELSKGDSVEVTGSLLDWDGEPLLVAREIRKGGQTVVLRDEQGVPAWSGGSGGR